MFLGWVWLRVMFVMPVVSKKWYWSGLWWGMRQSQCPGWWPSLGWCFRQMPRANPSPPIRPRFDPGQQPPTDPAYFELPNSRCQQSGQNTRSSPKPSDSTRQSSAVFSLGRGSRPHSTQRKGSAGRAVSGAGTPVSRDTGRRGSDEALSRSAQDPSDCDRSRRTRRPSLALAHRGERLAVR